MKNVHLASLCRGGVLGGALYLEENMVCFVTGKLTVEPKYRNMMMQHADILSVEPVSFWLPLVDIRLKNGETYRFLVFARRSFLKKLHRQLRT